MLGRFGRDAGSLLGVEIASDSIRMLQLQRRRGRCKVVGWAREYFETPLRGPHVLDEDERLLQALGQAHRRCVTRQRQVALALPASQVICKVCRLAIGEPERDAEAQLLEQAEQLFPFPLDDLALDFQVLGVSAGHPGHADVLVAACRQSQIDPFEHLFARAGLQVVAMEVDSIALRRALPFDGGSSTLIQLEGNEAVLHGWQGEVLPQRTHIALASQEQWLDPVDRLWQSGGWQCKAQGVVLTGGAASAPRAEQLAERLNVDCRFATPAALSELAEDAALATSMALACGLALGGLR
jgi:type IV pilus assembly protein PilM